MRPQQGRVWRKSARADRGTRAVLSRKRLAQMAARDAVTTTELAAQLAADPRFRGDTGDYFDEVAAQYGRDFAGIAWIQAALKIDQEAITTAAREAAGEAGRR